MNNWFFTVHTNREVITVKDKMLNILKKLQSYSFIIFIALVVVAFLIVVQLTGDKNTKDPSQNQPVIRTDPQDVEDLDDYADEIIKLPLKHSEYEIIRYYYDLALTEEEQQKSLIQIGNTFIENIGMNYTLDLETSFDVVASLTGEVIEVGTDEYFGKYVVIQHSNDIKTVYYSLDEIKVDVDDFVKQGDVIGTAGENMDEFSGIHVHFRILKGDKEINPATMIGKKLKDQ